MKDFLNSPDLSDFPESTAKTGRNGYLKRVLLCAFIVMKCECFSCITDLLDYLKNILFGIMSVILNFIGVTKNHVPVDCITGLPIFELTTAADAAADA